MAGSAGDGRGVARGGFEGVDRVDFGRVFAAATGGGFAVHHRFLRWPLWWTKLVILNFTDFD